MKNESKNRAIKTKTISKNGKASATKNGKKSKTSTVAELIQDQTNLRAQKFVEAKKFIQNHIKTKKPDNSMILYRLQNI